MAGERGGPSSDLRLDLHLHRIALDGAWSEHGSELVFEGVGRLKSNEVGDVLEHAVRRTSGHLPLEAHGGEKDGQ